MNIAQQFINIMGAKGVGGIVEPPVATGAFNLLDSPVGTLYNYQTASLFTGGTPTSYEWAGTPPTWAALDPLTGEIVGISTEGTWAGYAVVALNSAGSATTNTDTVTVSVFGNYGAEADAGQVDDGATYNGDVYYVDATGGDDANDGLTPATAWKTALEVSRHIQLGYWDTAAPNEFSNPPYHAPWSSVASGSAILFKRGEVFTGSLYQHAYMPGGAYLENLTIGAYGTGARPILNVVDNAEGTRFKGTGVGTNGNPIFIRNMDIQGDGVTSNSGVNLVNADNCHLYNTIVEGHSLDGISADGAGNLTIDNATVQSNQLGGGRGGGFAGGADNLSITNSTFKDNGIDQIGAHNVYARHLHNAIFSGNFLEGGSNFGLVIHGSSQGVSIVNNMAVGNSNGISVSGGYAEEEVFDNFNVSRNIVMDNGYRVGEQGYGMIMSSMTNSFIANNLITGNRLGSIVFSSKLDGDAPSLNTLISYNTITEPSSSWGFTLNGAGMSGVAIENNVISSLTGGTVFTKTSEVLEGEYTLNNNIYHAPNSASGNIFKFNSVDYDLAGIRSNFGAEVDGIYGDPLLDVDYKLGAGSPAIGAGVLNAITTDFDGAVRSNPPSMGCYTSAASAGFLVENSTFVNRSSWDTQYTSPIVRGFRWAPDGMSIYCATSTNFIHKYPATVPNDPTTLSNIPIGSIDIGIVASDVWVSDDELSLQFLGVDKKIHQWTMSVEGELSSATDDLSASIVLAPADIYGFEWSSDGLSLYVPDSFNDYVIQYTCVEAFNPSNISATTNGASTLDEDGNLNVITLVDDDTILLSSKISSVIYQYSMTGGDVTTMGLASTYAPTFTSNSTGLDTVGDSWYSMAGYVFNKYEVV